MMESISCPEKELSFNERRKLGHPYTHNYIAVQVSVAVGVVQAEHDWKERKVELSAVQKSAFISSASVPLLWVVVESSSFVQYANSYRKNK